MVKTFPNKGSKASFISNINSSKYGTMLPNAERREGRVRSSSLIIKRIWRTRVTLEELKMTRISKVATEAFVVVWSWSHERHNLCSGARAVVGLSGRNITSLVQRGECDRRIRALHKRTQRALLFANMYVQKCASSTAMISKKTFDSIFNYFINKVYGQCIIFARHFIS